MKTIFYDMDNTIALFSTKTDNGQVLERMYEKGFFLGLPVLDGADSVLKELKKQGYQVKILSACIDSPYCRQEKVQWLEKFFPFIEKKDIFLLNVGENKAKFLLNQGIKIENAFLVDDYSKNLLEWVQSGGIPIKKRYSEKDGWANIVRKHDEIYKILEAK